MRPRHTAVLTAPLFLLLAACGPAPGDGEHPPSCGVAPLVFDPGGDVLQASNASGACVRLERRPIGEPEVMYKEYPWEPLRLVAGTRDDFMDVRDGAALSYTPSHHNWRDVMTGTDEEGRQAEVVIRYVTTEDRWELELTLRAPDGAVVEGPLPLTPVGT